MTTQRTHRAGTVSGAPPAAALPDVAGYILTQLRRHFPADVEHPRQVLALAEEVGEFVGAYRRAAGMARRAGGWDDVAEELADVLITTHVAALTLGIDIDAAWRAKAHVICTRGWRDPRPGADAHDELLWRPCVACGQAAALEPGTNQCPPCQHDSDRG